MKKLMGYFSQDIRIHSMYVSWSHQQSQTSFSDIDIWIVCMEESDLASCSKTLPQELDKLLEIVVYYNSTPNHFFFVIKPDIQLDINIISASQYFNIKSLKKPLLNNFTLSPNIWSKGSSVYTQLTKKLLMWYTALYRGISKYKRWDYIVAIRFLQSIRDNHIRWLINLLQQWLDIQNKVNINRTILDPKLRELLKDLYPKPEKKEIAKAIQSTNKIFDMVSQKYKITKTSNSRSEKVKKIFKDI